MLLPEPAPPCLIDPVLHETQIVDTVRIGIDDDLDPELARPVQVHVVEVEPLRLGVELQGHVLLLGRLEHLIEVDVDRRALLELPARRVGEDVHGRMRQRLAHSPSHSRFRHVEAGVDGDQNDVEPFEHLVGKIQRAVRQDVELG